MSLLLATISCRNESIEEVANDYESKAYTSIMSKNTDSTAIYEYTAPNGYDTIHYYSSDPAYISNFSQYSPYLTNYIENSEIKYRTTFY